MFGIKCSSHLMRYINTFTQKYSIFLKVDLHLREAIVILVDDQSIHLSIFGLKSIP